MLSFTTSPYKSSRIQLKQIKNYCGSHPTWWCAAYFDLEDLVFATSKKMT